MGDACKVKVERVKVKGEKSRAMGDGFRVKCKWLKVDGDG